MAGNEDRGGMKELIQIIKTTQTPIICICNDMNHQKMRNLKNYATHLPFSRPTAMQMVPRISQICRAEGLSIDSPSIIKMCETTRADIRQIINMLQAWRETKTHISFDEVRKNMINNQKDFDYGPFDVAPNFFVSPRQGEKWLQKRTNFFFVDSRIMPLFVQENYLYCSPNLNNIKEKDKLIPDVYAMDCYSEAADFICDGDICAEQLWKDQSWKLMPMMAALSSIAPGMMVAGRFGSRINFPSWLGRNSTRNKAYRQLNEIKLILGLDVKCDRMDLALDGYLPLFRTKMLDPLIKFGADGIPESIKLLREYGLTRDDWDTLSELVTFSKNKGQINSKVKSAFTRKLNSEGIMLKVARVSGKTFVANKVRTLPSENGEEENNKSHDSDKEDKNDLKKDKMIKMKQSKSNKNTAKGRKRKT